MYGGEIENVDDMIRWSGIAPDACGPDETDELTGYELTITPATGGSPTTQAQPASTYDGLRSVELS